MSIYRLMAMCPLFLVLMGHSAHAEPNWDLFRPSEGGPSMLGDTIDDADSSWPRFTMPDLPSVATIAKPGTDLLHRWGAAVTKLGTKTRQAIVKPFQNAGKSSGRRHQARQASLWERLTTPPTPPKPQTVSDWLGQDKPQ